MGPQPLNKCGVQIPPLRRVNRTFTMSSRKHLQMWVLRPYHDYSYLNLRVIEMSVWKWNIAHWHTHLIPEFNGLHHRKSMTPKRSKANNLFIHIQLTHKAHIAPDCECTHSCSHERLCLLVYWSSSSRHQSPAAGMIANSLLMSLCLYLTISLGKVEKTIPITTYGAVHAPTSREL